MAGFRMRIILGTAQLRRSYGVLARSAPSADGASALLEEARSLGITTVDTAPTYGDAEAFLGASGSDFAIHTKLPSSGRPGEALAASLARLRRTSVDVLYLHDPALVLRPDDPAIGEASSLVGRGVGSLGASVYTVAEFEAAVRDPRIAVVQAPVNILDRRIDTSLLEAARVAGTRVVARSVLLQGLLAAPEAGRGRVPALDRALDRLVEVAALTGRTPFELAIGWVRTLPGIDAVVLGAEDADQLRRLVHAARSGPLSPDELEMLRAIEPDDPAAADPRTWSTPGR